MLGSLIVSMVDQLQWLRSPPSVRNVWAILYSNESPTVARVGLSILNMYVLGRFPYLKLFFYGTWW